VFDSTFQNAYCQYARTTNLTGSLDGVAALLLLLRGMANGVCSVNRMNFRSVEAKKLDDDKSKIN
jgi:hypothetical protein